MRYTHLWSLNRIEKFSALLQGNALEFRARVQKDQTIKDLSRFLELKNNAQWTFYSLPYNAPKGHWIAVTMCGIYIPHLKIFQSRDCPFWTT
jgi:hypothetical protein